MTAWNVYLNRKLIDTVFYNDDCNADYVRRGLIGHDGYSSAITVRQDHKLSRQLAVHVRPMPRAHRRAGPHHTPGGLAVTTLTVPGIVRYGAQENPRTVCVTDSPEVRTPEMVVFSNPNPQSEMFEGIHISGGWHSGGKYWYAEVVQINRGGGTPPSRTEWHHHFRDFADLVGWVERTVGYHTA